MKYIAKVISKRQGRDERRHLLLVCGQSKSHLDDWLPRSFIGIENFQAPVKKSIISSHTWSILVSRASSNISRCHRLTAQRGSAQASSSHYLEPAGQLRIMPFEPS